MGIAAVMLWVQLFQVLRIQKRREDLSSLSQRVHWHDCTWFHVCWNALQTLQHTATHCDKLQHAATSSCLLLDVSIYTHTVCTLRNTATHCNTLQHIAKHYRARHRWHYTELPSPRALSSHTHPYTHTHLFLLALNVCAVVAVCILLLSVRTRAHTYTRTCVLAHTHTHTGVNLVVAHGGIYVHCWYYVERLGPLALYYLRHHCCVWVGPHYSERRAF